MLPVFLPFLFGGQRRVVFELDFSRPQVQSLLHAKPAFRGATDGSGNQIESQLALCQQSAHALSHDLIAFSFGDGSQGAVFIAQSPRQSQRRAPFALGAHAGGKRYGAVALRGWVRLGH